MDNIAIDNKKFIGMATMISMPIMVQNLISTLVSTADTFMLSFVSDDALSASSLANNIYLVLWMTLNGLITGASVLTAQYWGKKDTRTIERILGLAVRFSMIIGIGFFILAFGFPSYAMRFFTNDTVIISEGVTYLRIVSFSYLLISFSMAYFSVLRSMEKVALPSVVFVLSLVINVCINATFIFGIFGAPKLGIAGVAIGTVTARAFECVTCIVHTLLSHDVKFRIRNVFAKSGALLGDFLKISIPGLVNDVAWSLAYSMYSVILGHLDSDAVAANAVANMALSIGAIVSRGFSNATTIIVGKALGANNKELAKGYARRMVILTFIFAALGGLVIIGIRPVVLNVYADKLSKVALGYLSAMLIMQSYHLIGEGLNTCWICGCFRGGGDAEFGMIIDCTFMWLVNVPLMATAAFILKLPVVWVYFVMCLDEFTKMPPVIIRYRKFNWLNNITRDDL